MAKQPYYAHELMIAKVVTLSTKMDVFDAIGVLLKNKISGAPVVDAQGHYVGVFSERNCLSMLVNAAYEQLPTSELSAFVTKDARTIEESTDVLAIAQIFLSDNCRRLPVLRKGELVGQVSRRDVLKVIHAQVTQADSPSSQLLYLSSLLSRDESPV
jgi:predicted transcriptional regulator